MPSLRIKMGNHALLMPEMRNLCTLFSHFIKVIVENHAFVL